MAQTQIILLERIEKLGKMGDTVTVKPGFARNYLLPEGKALRATKDNIAYFEAQRKQLEADNDKRKKEAEKLAKKLEGLKIPLIRQASEAGQLFGSVSSRDIADGATEISKETITREMVNLNRNFKMIGLFPIDVVLHPEVSVEVTINIARTKEEAQTQEKTGKALIADRNNIEDSKPEEQIAEKEAALEGVLEEGALEAEKEKQVAADEAAESEEKAKIEKAEAKAAEAKAKAEAAAEESSAEDKPEDKDKAEDKE